MARWIGLATDPTAGGTTYDQIVDTTSPVAIPRPDLWVPYTTATATGGSSNLDRDNEGRGTRASPAPTAFREEPRGSFECRAYPPMVKAIIARALSSVATATGTRPAALTTAITPTQSNPLSALVMHLLREEQYDVITGLAVNSFELSLEADAEGTIALSDGWGLYHDVADTVPGGIDRPTYTGLGDTYKLRDAIAYVGDSATRIDCLAGFTLSWSNNLIADVISRYCAGENVRSYTYNSNPYRIWLPARNKINRQTATGQLRFGTTRPDLELRRILSDAQRFVIECSAGPIIPATTPVADEMMRITFYKQALTDGGADALVNEGDIRSSYTYGAFADDSGNDVKVEFVSSAAVR